MKLVELLQQFRIEYREAGGHHHVTAGWVGLDCPYCSRNSGRFRLGYNLSHGYLSCWVCGYRSLLPTLREITGESTYALAQLLGEVHKEPRKVQERKRLLLPDGLQSLLPAHRKYLEERQFDPDELQRLWGIQGTGHNSTLPWRIFIPIHHKGEIVSWTTRAIADVPARYISARASQESIDAKTLLFGEDHVRHAVICVEGPFDVFRLGFGAAATLGVWVSRAQILRLSRYPVRVVCFDNEKEAQKRAKRLCESLDVFPGITHRVVLDAKDPGSATKQEVEELRRKFL